MPRDCLIDDACKKESEYELARNAAHQQIDTAAGRDIFQTSESNSTKNHSV